MDYAMLDIVESLIGLFPHWTEADRLQADAIDAYIQEANALRAEFARA